MTRLEELKALVNEWNHVVEKAYQVEIDDEHSVQTLSQRFVGKLELAFAAAKAKRTKSVVYNVGDNKIAFERLKIQGKETRLDIIEAIRNHLLESKFCEPKVPDKLLIVSWIV
jgi:hypothetical protein